MANTKKFAVKNGLQTQNIDFVSPSELNTITMTMLDSDTLSVVGNTGQLFSITDNQSGVIFAVNDVSGIPSIEVDDTGTIRLAETFGNVLIGTANDNGIDKLQVNGTISATSFTGNVVGNASTATKLAASVNINGVAFDGSASITVEDSTKLPLTGGTLTGTLNVSGSAGSFPLRVRGITGTDGGTTPVHGPLYLQYGANNAVHFGNTGAYTISADGSQYSGKAATATKLAASVNINGVAFDGSASITVADNTKFTRSSSSNANYDIFNDSYDGIHSEYVWQNSPFGSGTTNSIGAVMSVRYSQDWLFRTYFDIPNQRLFTQTKTSGTTQSSWKQLAYVTDNVASATKLQTARTINGVSFDGTSNITIADSTKLPLTGGTITSGLTVSGLLTATGGFKGQYVATDNRALKPNATSKGTIGAYFTSQGGLTGASDAVYGDLLVLNSYVDASGGLANALYFAKGSKSILHYQASQDATTWGTAHQLAYVTDNVASATKLAAPVNINGVAFDGSASITVEDSTKAPLASPALTGTPTAPTATDGTNSTQIATTAFVQNTVGGYLSKTGLTGGTVALTDVEVSNAVLYFAGTLTSNLVITVPTTNKRLWSVINGTTGAFTLTVKTPSGTGVTIAQGKRNLIYTDGTNVQDAFNDFESIALTGTPTSTTAAVGTNTTQIATTAFVNAEIANDAPTKTGTGASGTWGISITGNAATATNLQTARTINGVSFDGSADITIADSTKLPLTGGTLTGVLTTKASAVSTTIAGLGTGATAPIRVPNLQVGTTYGYVPFIHGAAQSSSGYIQHGSFGLYRPQSDWGNGAFYMAIGGNDSNPTEAFLFEFGRTIEHTGGAITLKGNADTATTLQTARTINGTSFNGSANITVPVNVTTLSTQGVDLNTFQTPGFYSCPANATASTLLNCPTTSAFSLLVEKHAGVKQTVTEYMTSGAKTYSRNMYNSAWGEWYRVYTTIDAPSSGATLANDTTTNASTFYPTMAYNTTSGNFTTAYVSSTELYFNPSTGQLNATMFNSLSDERKKTNIATIDNALAKVQALRGVQFTWKDNSVASLGVIAQEIEQVLPEVVSTSEDTGEKSVNYNSIIGVLIEAIKEQQVQINILKEQLGGSNAV